MINYIAERREEQKEDNIADPTCIATKKRPNAIGVDYNLYRKEIAAEIMGEILATINGRSMYYSLTSRGVAMFAQLMNTGIQRATIMRWLKKYEKFDKFLFTTLTLS
jgi:hypothetical protein